MVPGSEQPLLDGGCLQFGSHASGDVALRPGRLALRLDRRRRELRHPGLRAGRQPVRRPGRRGRLAALAGLPHRRRPARARWRGLADRPGRPASPPTAAPATPTRLVAYGQRNPWRLTFRPGTSELWSGDVGGSAWEEINRTGRGDVQRARSTAAGPATRASSARRRSAARRGTRSTSRSARASTPQGAGGGRRRRTSPTRPAVRCSPPARTASSDTSSISGVAFAPAASNYPAALPGLAVLLRLRPRLRLAAGQEAERRPGPGQRSRRSSRARRRRSSWSRSRRRPLLRRLRDRRRPGRPREAGGDPPDRLPDPAPVAAITVDRHRRPAEGDLPVLGRGTRTPTAAADLHAGTSTATGTFETSTGSAPQAQRRYAAKKNVTVTVRATNSIGRSDTASLTVYPGDHAADVHHGAPRRAPLTWKVGQKIRFAATATDQDQKLGPPAFTWALSIRHCPKVCHTHPIDQWPGDAARVVPGPRPRVPLAPAARRVTVTDSRGLTVHRSIRLDPKSVDLTFATRRSGSRLTAGGDAGQGPFTRTFIVGSHVIVSAPPTQRRQGVTYRFRGWSDGGRRSHDVVAPARRRGP